MDKGFKIHQNITWMGDTMISQVVSEIAGDMVKNREAEIMSHFETDFTELREFVEAKRRGEELTPVVRCKVCKHWDFGDCYRLELSRPDDFCSYGERKENEL